MKKKEKQTPTFFLLLKQGFKGIFKFKIQFIIILILSFLATFVLTISVATSRRLQDAYNQIVKKVEPFDFVGSTRISRTATENAGGASMDDFRSTALTDFINNTFVNSLSVDETGIETNNSSFNFLLNSQNYSDQVENAQTFITKVIDSQRSTGFYQLSLNYFKSTAAILNSTDPSEENKAQLALTKTEFNFALRDSFATQLIDDLITYRDHETDSPVAYLKNTSLAFFLAARPQYLDFFSDHFEPTDFYGFNDGQQRFVRYLYWISAQVADWIVKQLNTFAIHDPGDNILSDANATTAEDRAEVFYEFMTGKVFTTEIQPNFVITDPTNAYALNVSVKKEWDTANQNKYLQVLEPEENSQPQQALRGKGFRGLTSPISIKVGEVKYFPGTGEIVDPPYKGITEVYFLENYQEFSLLRANNKTPLTRDIDLGANFNVDYDIMDHNEDSFWSPNASQYVRASMMQYHIEFNARSAGFNAQFRKESIVFDNISSRKYRYVILNGRDDTNFTVLRGTAPAARHEIAISEQFARANRIRVGDYLSIGQALVMVTGFATDAFTFFPNVDPDFPVPQPKTEAVIYGSADTLIKIYDGNGEGTDGQNANPQIFSFFLTANQDHSQYSLETKKDLFISFQNDLATNLKNNFDYLNNLNQNQVKNQNLTADLAQATNSPLTSFFALKNFQDSNYRFSWTILPLVLNTFKIITYVSSLVIAIIAIIALVICIRKTIAFNAKQIGILKSLGTNPWMLSVTYLAHSLVIIGIIIPLAWILGTGLQVPFAMMFTQYFSAPTNMVLVDWVSIVIALFGFGVSAIVISIVAAYLVTRKPVMEIINASVKWSSSRVIDRLKITVFKNTSFDYRFSLTLSSSGKKPIALLVTVVGLTSLLISGAIAIPAIANNVISSYYKSVKYANAYENMTPTANSPLSKNAINFWQGNEKWDNDWIDSQDAQLKLDSTNANYGYYLDPEGYMDAASQASPIPKYIYLKEDMNADQNDIIQNFGYAYTYLLRNPGQFLDLATSAFGDNFFTVLGQSFNIGTVDQFFGLVLNADYETIRQLMGDDYDENLSLDANKQNLAINFSGPLTRSLPQIISIIINATAGTNPGGGTGQDWKQDVINVILTQVPPYIRTYINKSDSRLEQFAISFAAESYTPKQESFVSNFNAQTSQYDNVAFTGIDRNQEAYAVSDQANNRLYLNDADLDKVEQIFAGNGGQVQPFSAHGLQIWDGTNLTLPMLDNHQSEVSYNLKKQGRLTNVSTTTRQLKYRTNGEIPWKVLPKNAWAYDDSDFRNSNLFVDPMTTLNLNNSSLPTNRQRFATRYQGLSRNNNAYLAENNDGNDLHSSWLDVYAIDNSKFSYNNVFAWNSSKNEFELNDKTYFFNDFAFDTNSRQEIVGSYTRPYYQYKNVKLFLPTALINEEDILASSNYPSEIGPGPDSWYDKVNAQDHLDRAGSYRDEYKVPDSVLNAWGLDRSDNPEFLVINPYDLNYSERGQTGGGLDRLISGSKYPYWLRYAFDSDQGPGALTYNSEEPVVYGENNPQAKDFQLNFQVVGTIDSYDSRLLLTDANLANMVLGYSRSRMVGATNSYFNEHLGIDYEHNQTSRPWDVELDTYTFNQPQTDVAVVNNNANQRQKLASLTYLKNLNEANSYQPLKWHTGKLSNIDEPVSLTSSVSFNVRDNLGQYSLGLMYPMGLGVTTLITNQTLLSTQKALMNQIYSLAISLGALLIIAIVLTASLLIMLVGDVYIAQYLRFMILMRALGYSNKTIHYYAFGTVSILALIMWIIATIVAWAIIFGIISLIASRGFAIPYGLSWWPPLVSFVVIFISFFGSLLVSSAKVRSGEVSSLMNESQE